VQHFRGQGILWEMYNEPNIGFWKPKPNVEHYVKLALEVGRAVRAVAPDEKYIGPGTSQIDMTFLEACFRGGLLEYWCGVSVHPYRQKGPETAAAEYAALRRLIDRYAPGKTIPILSGEWGYSAAWKNYDETIQGKMLPRQWLVNLANDVPISIWYDWHDDGTDPKEAEHHFGTVSNAYHAGRAPVYDPKPAYRAAKTLTTLLSGFKLNKPLAVGGGRTPISARFPPLTMRAARRSTIPSRPIGLPRRSPRC
jgi:polysaccharide biosynthesis protein PslG